MLIMTAKVNFKKIFFAVALIAAAIGILLALGQGNSETSVSTAAPVADTNDARVQFLRNFGWEITVSPMESLQVKVPRESSEVFERYNALQKSQGYDLSKYAGKSVMRYVYEIKNYPDSTEPAYATLLVYKDQIIGGDITNTAPNGKIQGFALDAVSKP